MAQIEIRKLKPGFFMGLWHITEEEEFFESQLLLDDEEKRYLDKIKAPNKRLQWLASRLLIRLIVKPAGQIIMEWNEFGKPEIINYDFEVSISHCKDHVAVIVGSSASGIDIEQKSDRILRIAKKFCSEDERRLVYKQQEIEVLMMLWAAKEATFKRMGGGGIDFKEHMKVRHSEPITKQTKSFSMLYCKGEAQNLNMMAEWIGEFALVYCL